MDASTEQIKWFQFKPGVVVDSLRVAHCAAPTSEDGEVQAWCGLKFHPSDIEEAADPTSPPDSGKAPACAPCSACLLRLAAATDETRQPASTSPEDGKLAVVLRKAQWLLDDAAYYLPQGRCSTEDREMLAKTLDQLAALIREQGTQNLVIEQFGA
ncbi:hypothetical protein GCM10011581_36880 [Saccharopolyspora subtropica]|uniref:Uncharacterized protein n=1 Tax=Saccharopolyspora thermophila TaxID=89367 RepID=A0A917NFN1_9PSEU|nr:hypothetical protein [Saccharopolyspora subtropica]GGI96331.1 hypothetical protein GCM10011581_36880 [Saccharopolyspora subtropica]